MTEIRTHNTLEIDDDMAFERRLWRAQRVGRVALLALVIAAALGGAGDGPLSAARARSAGGEVGLEYQRFLRVQSGSEFRVYVAPQHVAAGRVRLWLGRDYDRDMLLREVSPRPVEVENVADGLIYHFAVADAAAPFLATFRVEPQRFGRRSLQVGLPDGERLAVWQFVYP